MSDAWIKADLALHATMFGGWRVVIPFDPVPKGRPRVTRKGFVYTPAATRKAEAQIKAYVSDRMLEQGVIRFESHRPLSVEVECSIERPKSVRREHAAVRPDLDNYLKLVMDALNGTLWEDDAQIVKIKATKAYAAEGVLPGFILRVAALGVGGA